MDIVELTDREGIVAAAELAAVEHERLRELIPSLPPRGNADYEPKLEWMVREGQLLGVRAGQRTLAFLGGFILDDYRNAGPGAFCPDWCHGAARPAAAEAATVSEAQAVLAYRMLYRELAARWVEAGIRIHAVATYASDVAALEAFSLTGFGRIVMDAAVDAEELACGLAQSPRAPTPPVLVVRRVVRADAHFLAELNARLASHIGASPVLMPRTHGSSSAEWEAWLEHRESCTFIAERDGKAVAYIKAEAPQFDVSDAVHGERTLAINGLFTEIEERRSGAATLLLKALATEAIERGADLVSVDCETTNIEAYAFWSRYFRPVTWSLERRV